MAGQALIFVGSGILLQGSVWIVTGDTGETRVACLAPAPAFFEAIGLNANHFEAALRDS